jgi:hypothetical protein
MSQVEAARRERQRQASLSPEARDHQRALLREYLDEQSTARELHVSVRALRAWRQQRRGPPWLKIGKSVFYKISAIEAWLGTLERKGGRSRAA